MSSIIILPNLDIVKTKQKYKDGEIHDKIYTINRDIASEMRTFSDLFKMRREIIANENITSINNGENYIYKSSCQKTGKVLCWWSRLTIENCQNCIGLPVKMEREGKKLKIICVGYFYNINCILSLAEEKEKEKDETRKWDNISANCRYLYNILYKKKLKHANHWSLLDINGGCLTQKQWLDPFLDINNFPQISVERITEGFISK